MKNLVFTIWMLGYPVVSELSSYLVFKRRGVSDDIIYFMVAVTNIAIWVYVARLLYEKPEKSK